MLSHAAPLSAWLTWLETLSPAEINLGLGRVELMLARLNLSRPAQVLLIAGTNGKGSSVTMADALLRASGHRVGAYTSPHIRCYNERIVVNGTAVSDSEIVSAFETIEAVRGDAELTYFEYGTLAAAVVFAKADLDVWLLEVGLGGRLDACNAIEPTASLITNISLDHCDWLGDDVETIAHEKAGVMRAGMPVVFGDSHVPEAITSHADAVGATLLLAGRDFKSLPGVDREWNWCGPSGERQRLLPPGLAGEFQIRNAAAVLALLDAAGFLADIDAGLINTILPELRLSGRSQHLRVESSDCASSNWFLDVAHNPAAAEALAETLCSMQPAGARFAIVGMLGDKDVAGVIGPLADQVEQWIAMTADSHRALPADKLAWQIARQVGKACLIAESPAEAIEFARRLVSENDRILVTGSFFAVAPILDKLAADSQPKS